MSNSKLLKYLERLIISKSVVSRPILISHSKGYYLNKHLDLLKISRVFVQFECRPGARFADFYPWLKRNLAGLVQQYGQITLYIWLGTCDITQKSGKYIDLREIRKVQEEITSQRSTGTTKQERQAFQQAEREQRLLHHQQTYRKKYRQW
ncbi:uncharacterized protein LOC134283229 [Saccostrea cucullata]|uniref:uncharacterized protein LOC134283229 n=1 Tax=Saccostrea cuccullata TaxID=36930 RepID=UPI002ED24579